MCGSICKATKFQKLSGCRAGRGYKGVLAESRCEVVFDVYAGWRQHSPLSVLGTCWCWGPESEIEFLFICKCETVKMNSNIGSCDFCSSSFIEDLIDIRNPKSFWHSTIQSSTLSKGKIFEFFLDGADTAGQTDL